MNHAQRQVIHRTVKRFTAFKSFADLIQAAVSHNYTPTIIAWRGHCLRDKIRIRALAVQFDKHFEEIGSHRRCYTGGSY